MPRLIVEAMRNLSPPGRFLEKDVSTGSGSDIGDKKAVEHTRRAFRNGHQRMLAPLCQPPPPPCQIGNKKAI